MAKSIVMSVAVGRPLLQVLELCYTARRSPLLIGSTGTGKSMVLQQFAAQNKLACITRDLSIMDPTDLTGLPQLEEGQTRFFPPNFLPRNGKGILFFEELNRAPAYMRAPTLQLLTDRSLNDYRLPSGWLCAAAINPADQGYEVAELDPALMSRFVQLYVHADRDEWLAWARGQEIHPQVISYVEADSTVFESTASNPRAWATVSALLQAAAERQTPRPLLQAAVAGCVGPERATAFFHFFEDAAQPLKAHDIFTGYAGHRAAVRSWITDGKLDLLQGTLLNVLKGLQSSTDFQAAHEDPKACKHLARFLDDLPGDLRAQAEAFFREHEYPLPTKSRRSA